MGEGTKKAHITGLYTWDGREWIIWEDAGDCLHVTDGVIDVTSRDAVRDYLMVLKRAVAIDRMEMLDKLERYQPGSPLIGLLRERRVVP